MPALVHNIGAAEETIGTALFVYGACSLLSLAAGGWLCLRCGSKKILLSASVLFLIGLFWSGASMGVWEFFAAMACIGAGLGAAEVAMNIQAVYFEKEASKNAMAFMHTGYSLGTVAGASAGAVCAALGIETQLNFFAAVILIAVIEILAGPYLYERTAAREAGVPALDSVRGNVPFIIIALAVIALFAGESEGAIGDWGSLFLTKELGASEAIAGLAVGAFSSAGIISRLAADPIRSKIGNMATIASGVGVGAAGILLSLFCADARAALLGFAIAGAGISPVVPVTVSVAASLRGVSPEKAAAVISGFCYAGILFIPPALGWLAGDLGLRFSFVAVLAALLAVLTLAGTCELCLRRQ